MIRIFPIFIILFSLNLSSFAQCNHTKDLSFCKSHLAENQFIFIKEFQIDTQHGEAHEYSYPLTNKGSYEYYFTGDDWNSHTMTATLYGPNHEVIQSNHPTDKEFLHVIKFEPTEVGIYYIKFSFSNPDESFCGAAVLGYHKNQN